MRYMLKIIVVYNKNTNVAINEINRIIRKYNVKIDNTHFIAKKYRIIYSLINRKKYNILYYSENVSRRKV